MAIYITEIVLDIITDLLSGLNFFPLSRGQLLNTRSSCGDSYPIIVESQNQAPAKISRYHIFVPECHHDMSCCSKSFRHTLTQ